MPKSKYKSPSSIAYRDNRIISKNIQSRNRPPPNSRAVLKSKLASNYGLPSETKFLFFKKGSQFDRPPLHLYFGTIVCFDQDTCELLLVARFNKCTVNNKELFEDFNHAISTLFQHGQARHKVSNNRAVNAAKKKSCENGNGKMYGVGFRPGYDSEAKAGAYALNARTSADFKKMEEDLKRQGNLPKIENFLGERFAGLSLYAHESNLQIAAKTKVPSWAGQSFYVSPNAQVFGSNLVITFDNFFNNPHCDKDASKFAMGLFANIHRVTGDIYFHGENAPQGRIEGAKFILDNYNVLIDYGKCDGVVEQVWNTRIFHHTSESITYDSNGTIIPATKASITRFGSACQISQALVVWIEQASKLRGEMSDSEWAKHRPKLLTSYGHELHKKIKILASKLGIDPL